MLSIHRRLLSMKMEIRVITASRFPIINLTRFSSTIHTRSDFTHWDDEDLSQATKLKIENYWKEKLHYPSFDQDQECSKYYVLSMFPYPSGTLHMGHIRVYSISDTLARFYRMIGKNVLHPMGWDAFGLPAENAAIERGLSSSSWTADNINTMREQLHELCCTFDWSREISTCHKDYYKFTQTIFLKMFEQGLVYQKKASVNWDPIDQTVLADEQVDDQGCSWRSGAKVEKKILKQWFIRTTSFAKDLYDGLNRKDLEDWRDIIDLQKQWIGSCDGVSFEFPLKGMEGELTLWIDKPEHLPYAEFVAVQPGSVLDIETEGTGERKLKVEVINSLTGQLLPVYVTDKLPFFEGADARICFPEVNDCDLEFARRVEFTTSVSKQQVIKYDPQNIIKTIKGRVCSSKLRDWLISRQRHWGTPIPMVHCVNCGPQPVPYEMLPVELPKVESTSSKKLQSNYSQEWSSTSCPKCGGTASRDKDTMDTFVDSSWYFLRYLDPRNDKEPFSKDIASKFMPVDIYVGGKEHAVLHLYYARFVSYFLHSLGWLPDSEPFKRLVVQGMVMGKTYRVKGSGKYIPASQVDIQGDNTVDKVSGKPVVVTWDKMSKSKHNGVDPGEMFRQYGVDTTRLLIMGTVAPTSQRNWDDSTFPGILNWQRRLWLTVQEFRKARLGTDTVPCPVDLTEAETRLRDSRNYYLRGITVSYRVTHQFNTAIARMQGLTGDLRGYGAAYQLHSKEYLRTLAALITVLSPLAPHLAAEMWTVLQVSLASTADTRSSEFHWDKPVHLQPWPQIDEDYLLTLVCSVNNAVKDELQISRLELDQLTIPSATQLALTSSKVKIYTDQTQITDASLKLYSGLHASVDLCLDYTKLRFSKEHFKNKEKFKKKKHLK